MGINGLLHGLKPFSSQGNVRNYAGHAVAVDASSWLHRSVYSIADHYVETTERMNGKVDARCIASSSKYMVTRCRELLNYAKIKRIYLVLDGKRCPMKAVTSKEREHRRQENLREARQYRRQGHQYRDKMYDKYKACIKVSSHLVEEVAKTVRRSFRQEGVELVWAPQEADAQMVKLCVDGKAQAIITEDSDIMVYAATCNVAAPILFKLDRHSGKCDVISMDWLLSPNNSKAASAENESKDNNNKKKSSGLKPILDAFILRQSREPGLGVRLFVQACVLAGCDYAPNELNGVGLVTAFKHVRSAIHRVSGDRFSYVLKNLPQKAKNQIQDIAKYEDLLAKSEAVFYYHPVKETKGGKQVVHLNEPSTSQKHYPTLKRFGTDWAFMGSVSGSSNTNYRHEADRQTIRPTNATAAPEPKNGHSVPEVIVVQNKYKKSQVAPNKQELLGKDGPAYPHSPTNARKRKHGTSQRKPLQPKRPNHERAPPSRSHNFFAQFAHQGEENNTRRLKGIRRLAPGADVRFVKGKPKIPNKPTAKGERPNPHPSNLIGRFSLPESCRRLCDSMNETEKFGDHERDFLPQALSQKRIQPVGDKSSVSEIRQSDFHQPERLEEQGLLPGQCRVTSSKTGPNNNYDRLKHNGEPEPVIDLTSTIPNHSVGLFYGDGVDSPSLYSISRRKKQPIFDPPSSGSIQKPLAAIENNRKTFSFGLKKHDHQPSSAMGIEDKHGHSCSIGSPEDIDVTDCAYAPKPCPHSRHFSERRDNAGRTERSSFPDDDNTFNEQSRSRRITFGSETADECQLDTPVHNFSEIGRTHRGDQRHKGMGVFGKNTSAEADPSAFEFYDDFLSPKQKVAHSCSDGHDDIVESPCFSQDRRSNVPSFVAIPPRLPKPISTIGPAKTHRNRFGAIGKAFQRQTQAKLTNRQQRGSSSLRASSLSAPQSRPRGPFSLGRQKSGQKRPTSNRGTLFSHFSLVVRDEGDDF